MRRKSPTGVYSLGTYKRKPLLFFSYLEFLYTCHAFLLPLQLQLNVMDQMLCCSPNRYPDPLKPKAIEGGPLGRLGREGRVLQMGLASW